MILHCYCGSTNLVSVDIREQIEGILKSSGCEVEGVADLCGLVARHDPSLREWAEDENLLIVACFPRALRALFRSAGLTLRESVRFFNPRMESMAVLKSLVKTGCVVSSFRRREWAESWDPWFPVIDYDRCRNCKQCLNFCLFGVYEQDENGKVVVKNPASCKTNCPACARICPDAAILFPKYTQVPINGAEVENEEEVRAQAGMAEKEILGDDVMAALEARKKRRRDRMLIRNPPAGQDANLAKQERARFSESGS